MLLTVLLLFFLLRPKRKVTKSPAVRGAASIIAYNKFERQKRAPKSKTQRWFPSTRPVDSHTKQRCGNQNAHHRLQRTNPSISVPKPQSI